MKVGIYLLVLVFFLAGCYSFKGISIPDEISTFNVPFIEVISPDAPPSININLQEKLILKITRESRLTFTDSDPDIIMNASITGYNVEAIGANSENSVNANKLSITVKVDYVDAKNEKNNWKKNFSQNREFAAGVNLLSVQADLIEQIFTDISEDIFNFSFTNW